MRWFFGCAAYRTMEPVTAACREEILGSMLPSAGAMDLGEFGSAECVGSGIEAGYGCCPNLERLTERALFVDADVLLFHDADMSFTPVDVRQVLVAWAANGPQCMVGAMYPEAAGDRLVGAITGIANECGAYTRRGDVPDPTGGDGVYDADFLGLGLAAVPIAFFANLPRPWWREGWDGAVHLGPDMWISHALRAESWNVVAALHARPAHLSREWRRL